MTQRIAVVTGGASGIGEATARRFAKAGDFVVIGDIDTARAETVVKSIQAEGGGAEAHRVDVAEAASIDGFVEIVMARYGRADALVNSGGVLQNAVRMAAMDIAEFDRIWNINVRGTMLAGRAFGSAMCAAGSGAIINLCSLTTFRPSAQPAYAVGKAGLKMLTEVMAAEYGPSGVRVNAVAPGYTLTPAMQARIDSGARDPRTILDKSALRRFVQPAEVAEAIFFLCSPAASAITGVTLPIDAGWLAYSAYSAYAAQPD